MVFEVGHRFGAGEPEPPPQERPGYTVNDGAQDGELGTLQVEGKGFAPHKKVPAKEL